MMFREAVWNGLRISDPNPVASPSWVTTEMSLLGDASAVAATGQRVQRDGQWRTTAYRAALTGGLSGTVEAATTAEAEAQLRLLRTAASINPGVLTVYTASGPMTIVISRDADLSVEWVTPTAFRWSTAVTASDPVWWWGGQTPDGRVDDSAAQVHAVGLPHQSGGLTFPIDWPIDFATTGDTGDILVAFDGPARMEWRIDGPVAAPAVTVENSDGARTVAWSLTVTGGEYLAVNPHTQQALLQGQSSRTPWLRQWPRLTPGENAIRFRADAFSASALLTVAIRPLAS